MHVDREKTKRLIAAFALGSAVWTGCDSHDEGSSEPVGPASGAVCPPTQTLTYENFGRDFMQKNCLRCHSSSVTGAARAGAPSDHNFDTLDEIQGLREHIDQRAGAGPAATNVNMPPGPPAPTEDERKKLGEWLACGAP